MATRLYVVGSSSVTISGYDAGWNRTSASLKFALATTKNTGATYYNSTSEASSSPYRDLCSVFVSEKLAAATISGTVSLVIQAWETPTAANGYACVKITIRKPDGTVRGTLLAMTTDDVEYDTTSMSRVVLSSVSLSSVDAQAEDRIVVELGTYFNNTKTTAYTAGIDTYNASVSDFLMNDTETAAYNSWLEFSQNISWYTPAVDIIVYPPAASMTMTSKEPRPVRDIPAVAMTMTPLAPTLGIEGVMAVYPPAAEMALTSLAPTYDDHVEIVAAPVANMTLTALAPTYDAGLTEIRQEINMLCHVLSAASGSDATSNEIVQLNDDFYSDGTFYFEIAGYTSASLSVDIKLRRKGTSTDDATCTIPAGTTVPTVIRSSSFTPPTSATEYVVYIPNTSGATKYVVSARIVILQKAINIEKTESQYEIGNYETGKNNTSASPLDYPKYFKMGYAERSNLGWVIGEVVYKVQTGATVTITLQEDDGAFGVWTDRMKIVDAGNATTATRIREYMSTDAQPNPLRVKQDRHYRLAAYISDSGKTYDIYCAKIICLQGTFGFRELDPTLNSVESVVVSTSGKSAMALIKQAGFYWADLYSSSDYGGTWWKIKDNANYLSNSVPICLSDNGTHKFYISYGDHVVSSNDAGGTWTQHDELPDADSPWIVGLCCSSDGQYVYFGYKLDGSNEVRIYKSSNYGVSFTQILSDASGSYNYIGLRCDDTGQYVAYGKQETNFMCYVSDDYGVSFTGYNTYTGSTGGLLTSMSRDGSHIAVYVGPGYLSRVSHDYGETWETMTARPSGYSVTYSTFSLLWFESNDVWWGHFKYGWDGCLAKSEDSGASWTRMIPSVESEEDDFGNLIINEAKYAFSASEDGKVVMWGTRGYCPSPLVLSKRVSKIQGEYLLENTYNNDTGLTGHHTKFKPSDWKPDAITVRHIIDSSSDSSNSAKLQTDPNGTPTDIAGSTATGAYRAESDVITLPESEVSIDSNILDVPIYASKMIAKYEVVLPITPDIATMTFTPLEPTIYPLKLPVPVADMTLTPLVPGYYIPPQIFAYPPAASMRFATRSVNWVWDIQEADRITARNLYTCILTGDGESPPLDDLTLPMEYFQAQLTDILESYVMCVIPDANTYADEIIARSNGEIVISSGYRIADGTEMLEEIFRMPFTDMTISRGGRRESVSIIGRGVIDQQISKERTATGVTSYKKQINGKRVISCNIDLFLRCGDVFIYGEDGNDYVVAGTITYEAGTNPPLSQMTVTEL